MRNFGFVLLLFLFSSSPSIVSAQDLEQGLAAYNRHDYVEALRNLEPLAAHNNGEALFTLGRMYANGEYVPKSFDQARSFFLEAYKAGKPEAATKLANMYQFGDGVPRDIAEARRWRSRASEMSRNGDRHEPAEITVGRLPLRDTAMTPARENASRPETPVERTDASTPLDPVAVTPPAEHDGDGREIVQAPSVVQSASATRTPHAFDENVSASNTTAAKTDEASAPSARAALRRSSPMAPLAPVGTGGRSGVRSESTLPAPAISGPSRTTPERHLPLHTARGSRVSSVNDTVPGRSAGQPLPAPALVGWLFILGPLALMGLVLVMALASEVVVFTDLADVLASLFALAAIGAAAGLAVRPAAGAVGIVLLLAAMIPMLAVIHTSIRQNATRSVVKGLLVGLTKPVWAVPAFFLLVGGECRPDASHRQSGSQSFFVAKLFGACAAITDALFGGARVFATHAAENERSRSTTERARETRETEEADETEKARGKNDDGGFAPTATAQPFDPYTVLSVPRGVTKDMLRSRYHELTKQYHPDRVHGLGSEIQAVAQEQMKKINRAYAELMREV